nr:RecName: Full=Laccase [Sanghuangporus baumii]
AIGPVDEV